MLQSSLAVAKYFLFLNNIIQVILLVCSLKVNIFSGGLYLSLYNLYIFIWQSLLIITNLLSGSDEIFSIILFEFSILFIKLRLYSCFLFI